MRHVDVEKKRPDRWPWILGLVVLGLAIWGVTILLRPPPEPEPPAVATAATDTLPPAAIPSAEGGASAQRSARIGQLVPLEAQDVGTRIRMDGEVVATGNTAFWVVAEGHVLLVESQREARTGDSVSITGILQRAEDTLTDRVASDVISRSPRSDQWTLVRSFKLVEETEPAAGTEPGAHESEQTASPEDS